MNPNNTKRLSRLTAILTQLQSRRLLTASKLAEQFGVTVRTIYRDIRALEDAGVPIFTEEGKGYSLIEGYRIPPVMFTEDEANAIITAGFIIYSCKDESLIKEFTSAVQKLKAIIPDHLKTRVEILEEKIGITKTYTDLSVKSKYLLDIQKALVEYLVIKINYTNQSNQKSSRQLEPFAVYSSEKGDWVLVAYCRLRKDFRTFSLTRIEELIFTDEKFEPSPMTFAQYRKKTYGN
ncbi:DNA-binding transcriptional regulator [Calothrix sp. HK-06]|nr:DNA-binding transcriptional regulator [Calothrix sp. HK-06]